MPDFSIEDSFAGKLIAGVDEAGRGPWAGPVVAGAVIIDRDLISDELILGLDDSKKLKPKMRESLFELLHQCAVIGVGIADVAEIDEKNILQATMLAMGRAVENLNVPPTVALIDGNRPPKLDCRAQCVVRGDGISLSIAAASIVAKVTRDHIMAGLAQKYPGYGWETNQGYGTKAHREGLQKLGISKHHRKSFAPIRAIIEKNR
ncbi:MAG: ribonuclease HII [Rhodospirillaceae bacterium]|nr:ribonuclease HII [Rhodospirillaceae bacterium]